MKSLLAIKTRLCAAVPNPDIEWAALTDPGDRKTAPAWIVDADDIEVRMPASYRAGKVADLIANAPTDISRLIAAVEAVSDWAGKNKAGYYDEAQDDVVAILSAALGAEE